MDGRDFEEYANGGHDNMLLHAIFKSLEMEINNKPGIVPRTMHAYRAFMETMLSFFEGVEKTRLCSESGVKNDGTGEALD